MFASWVMDSINPVRISLPYEDAIKPAQWLQRRPYADAERLAAGGGSYGRLLAATLPAREHPFKPIIAHAAVNNSFTQLGNDDGAEKARFFNFGERPEEFARYSPHTFAGNFETPRGLPLGHEATELPVLVQNEAGMADAIRPARWTLTEIIRCADVNSSTAPQRSQLLQRCH